MRTSTGCIEHRLHAILSSVAVVCCCFLSDSLVAAANPDWSDVVDALGSQEQYLQLPNYHAIITIEASSPSDGRRYIKSEEWCWNGHRRVDQRWYSPERSPETKRTIFFSDNGEYTKYYCDEQKAEVIEESISKNEVPLDTFPYRLRLLCAITADSTFTVNATLAPGVKEDCEGQHYNVSFAGGDDEPTYNLIVCCDPETLLPLYVEWPQLQSRRSYGAWRDYQGLSIPSEVMWRSEVEVDQSTSVDTGQVRIESFEFIDGVPDGLFEPEFGGGPCH